MGSSKSVDIPPDPDPTPTNVGSQSADARRAALDAKKQAGKNYGRSKTLLASNTDNAGKSTILGG